MVDVVTVATLFVACLASLFMAWAIGAGSSGSTPFAPAVGANAISVMRAGFFVGVLGFAGAVLQGANVTEAVGRELVLNATLSPIAAIIALVLAALLVAIGVFAGYPIATAFTVTGAVIGVGLAAGGDPAWAKYRQIAALWLFTPFVGGSVAYATARCLRSERISERAVVPALAGLVGLIVAYMDFAVLGGPDEGASIARTISLEFSAVRLLGIDLVEISAALGIAGLGALLVSHQMGRDHALGQQRFLLVLGGLVAFSAGGSQVGLALGPLLPLLDPFAIPLWAVLVGGGVGLLLGSWTGAPRMIKALSQDYSSLGPRRSIAALIPAFAIAQTAVLYGIPVSFNEIMVSTIIGSGYAAGSGGVSGRKMAFTVLAWVASFVLALAFGYGLLIAVGTVL